MSNKYYVNLIIKNIMIKIMVGGQLMLFKKLIISGILCTSIIMGSTIGVQALSTTYTVQKGETYWIISQKLNVPISSLMTVNNATQSTVLYIGQNIAVPQYSLYTVVSGDAYWKVSQKFGVNINELLSLNGANEKSCLYIGQQIKIPLGSIGTATATSTKPYITYKNYTVQKGDILWNLANKFGIPLPELLKSLI
jgi:LysM repeat protein